MGPQGQSSSELIVSAYWGSSASINFIKIQKALLIAYDTNSDLSFDDHSYF